MEHPDIQNRTPFHAEVLHLEDENAAFLCCVVVKATYDIVDGKGLVLSAEQQPLNHAGEYWGPPDQSSYKYEPENAFVKLATDVVLLGYAQASSPNVQTLDVGLKVGPVQKIVRVFGDRYWVKTGGSIIATRPQPIDRVPLVYERAFGGWDKANKDQTAWRCDTRNPVGRGFGDPLRYAEEGKIALPNLEDPNHLLKRYGDTPPPAGFGFVSPHWQGRARYAGTYDDAWEKKRKPLLPHDFDRRFFNAASPGLVAQGYLRGTEDVVIVNAAPVPQLRFNLPGVASPACKVALRGGRHEIVQTNLDTVIINAAEMKVFLLWRGSCAVRNGVFDVAAVDIGTQWERARATA